MRKGVIHSTFAASYTAYVGHLWGRYMSGQVCLLLIFTFDVRSNGKLEPRHRNGRAFYACTTTPHHLLITVIYSTHVKCRCADLGCSGMVILADGWTN